MTAEQRTARLFVLATTLIPPALIALAVAAWSDVLFSPLAAAIGAVTYFLTGFGLYAGYHRMLTHRAFKTSRPMKIGIVALGIMGGEGPPIPWVAQHRRHHAVADAEGDPHSPHAHGQGLRGALRGLWWAHLGWLLDPRLDSQPLRYAPDLVRDRDLRRMSRHFLPITLAGLLLPGLAGLALSGGSLREAALALFWGGPLRMLVQLHATYSVNSVGHYFGSRRFATEDRSRNVAWLAIPALGEGWHHNHHAFPRATSLRLRAWEVDLVGAALWLLERAGLIWDTYRPTAAEQAELLVPQGQPAAAGAAAPAGRTT